MGSISALAVGWGRAAPLTAPCPGMVNGVLGGKDHGYCPVWVLYLRKGQIIHLFPEFHILVGLN